MTDLKKKIKFLINRTNLLYSVYLENRSYANAHSIKLCNTEIIGLLLKDGWQLDNPDCVNKILTHFEMWLVQFIELEKQVVDVKDDFVFGRIQEATPYPKSELDELLN